MTVVISYHTHFWPGSYMKHVHMFKPHAVAMLKFCSAYKIHLCNTHLSRRYCKSSFFYSKLVRYKTFLERFNDATSHGSYADFVFCFQKLLRQYLPMKHMPKAFHLLQQIMKHYENECWNCPTPQNAKSSVSKDGFMTKLHAVAMPIVFPVL